MIGGAVGMINRAIRRAAANAGGGDWWLSGGVLAAGCEAAYQPIGAASYAASKVNLNNPGTNDATEGIAPAWATGVGWTFDGNDDYLSTGVSPVAGGSMICRFSDGSVDATQMLAGMMTGPNNRFYLMSRHTLDKHYYGYGDVAAEVAGRLVAGVMALAGATGYLDGAFEVATGGTLNALDVREIAIGAQNNEDQGYANLWRGVIEALAIYNITLTAPQVDAITTAMQAL